MCYFIIFNDVNFRDTAMLMTLDIDYKYEHMLLLSLNKFMNA